MHTRSSCPLLRWARPNGWGLDINVWFMRSSSRHLPRSCFVVLLCSSAAFPQSDAEKFAEGRIAFDAHHDCPAALDALQSVSDTGRKSPLWAFYMGKVEECLKRPTEALTYYEQYDQLVPGQRE